MYHIRILKHPGSNPSSGPCCGLRDVLRQFIPLQNWSTLRKKPESHVGMFQIGPTGRLRGLGRDDYVVTESGSRMVKVAHIEQLKDLRPFSSIFPALLACFPQLPLVFPATERWTEVHGAMSRPPICLSGPYRRGGAVIMHVFGCWESNWIYVNIDRRYCCWLVPCTFRWYTFTQLRSY